LKNPSLKAPLNSWIIGPFTDLSVFIATPLAIIPAFHFLSAFLSLAVFKLGILSISATGHHLPGFIRAYTDKKIFNQFKARLIVIPAMFILLTLTAAYLKLSLIFFILIVWSTWHGSMQILGFLRIYDVKSKVLSSVVARLDYWMCLTWFVQIVLWSAPKKMSVLSAFYLAGGPLISTAGARACEWAWSILTAAVTLAYLARLAWDLVRNRHLNIPKLLCMVSSFGFWGYCMISINNLLIGLILWEIFHDLQYNVFVWNYNRNRVRRDLSGSRTERFLFQADGRKILLYSLCIAAYGCIGLLSQDVLNVYQNQKTYQTLLFQIGNVFAASALIHFYLDGFIWKVRDAKVQRDLGVEIAEPNGKLGKRPRARHAVLMSAFVIACLGLGASEYLHWTSSQQSRQSDSLVELVPKSGYANFMKATRLKSEEKNDSAIYYYERAIQSDTNYNFSHIFLADLKAKTGDLAGSIAHYKIAESQEPEDALVRENLAELYMKTEAFDLAQAEYRFLAAMDSSNADYAYRLAFVLLQSKKGREAKPYLEKSLRLDPNQPKALNYLGMVEQATGNREKARELYRQSLALDSTYAHARQNLNGLGL
jgi:tetratricopeptide (TPR) repeat protein